MLAENWQSLHDSHRKLTMAILFWILSIVAWWQPKIDHRCIIHAENFVAEILLFDRKFSKILTATVWYNQKILYEVEGQKFFWTLVSWQKIKAKMKSQRDGNQKLIITALHFVAEIFLFDRKHSEIQPATLWYWNIQRKL